MRRSHSGNRSDDGRYRWWIAACLVTLLLSGCSSAFDPAVPFELAETERLPISAEAEARAEVLLAEATTIEPQLTALLVDGAQRLGIQLWGLRNRVKGRESLARKIQTTMLEDGSPADTVTIDDVLRYTAVIEDRPPGRYNEAVADILGRAEAGGFPPLRVKNYWPEGDTYSGINCVLSSPSGLTWELQFHTIGSLAAKQEGHSLYEVYRLPTTPLKQRRRIFDRLAERWEWVEIPEGILEPYSVHPTEEIKVHARP